jgi:hypothetical protein
VPSSGWLITRSSTTGRLIVSWPAIQIPTCQTGQRRIDADLVVGMH